MVRTAPADCSLIPSLVDSILEAVFTVSPNKQYRGILVPTTPATTAPVNKIKYVVFSNHILSHRASWLLPTFPYIPFINMIRKKCQYYLGWIIHHVCRWLAESHEGNCKRASKENSGGSKDGMDISCMSFCTCRNHFSTLQKNIL